MAGDAGGLDLLLPDLPLWEERHGRNVRTLFREETDEWQTGRSAGRGVRDDVTGGGSDDESGVRGWFRRLQVQASRRARLDGQRHRDAREPVRRIDDEREDILEFVERLAGLTPGQAARVLGGPVASHRRPRDLEPVDHTLRSVLVATALCHREERLVALRDTVAALTRVDAGSDAEQRLEDVVHRAAMVELAEVADALDRIEMLLDAFRTDPAGRLEALARAGVHVALEVAASDHEGATERWEVSGTGRRVLQAEEALEHVRVALDDAVCGPWSDDLSWDEAELTLQALLDRAKGREPDGASGWRPATRSGAIVRPDRRKHEWLILAGIDGWQHLDVLQQLVARLALLEDEVASIRRDSVAEMAARRRGASRRLARLAEDLDDEQERLTALRAARRELGHRPRGHGGGD